jgi:hypothetical protein
VRITQIFFLSFLSYFILDKNFLKNADTTRATLSNDGNATATVEWPSLFDAAMLCYLKHGFTSRQAPD